MAYDDDDDDLDISVRRGGGPVSNYLTQAILVTLCCCIPCGIVAIVKASQVNGFLAAGDYERAVQASDAAKTWCIVAFIGGLIVNGIYIAIQASRNIR